jgi:hypothetical protein
MEAARLEPFGRQHPGSIKADRLQPIISLRSENIKLTPIRITAERLGDQRNQPVDTGAEIYRLSGNQDRDVLPIPIMTE